MKVLYIGVLKKPTGFFANKEEEQKQVVTLCSATYLKSSFNRFTQGSAAQFMDFSATLIVARANLKDERHTVEENNNRICMNMKAKGFAGVIICDHEYPERVAHQLLNKVVDEFIVKYPKPTWENNTTKSAQLPFPELSEWIEKYQDPEQVDSISKIQKELDETKIVLHKTIESVLERGEKIDSLVAKSDNLSYQSKAFYGQAKKQNSCCVVM